MLVRRPVKIALTMEEQFYMITKHPTTFRIKSGVDKDGRIIARACEVYWNGGAYADIGPRVTQKSGFTAAGPYDIENVSIDSYALYTNPTPAGALPGLGVAPAGWGAVWEEAALGAVLDALWARIGWNAPFDRGSPTLRRGRGIAIGLK